MSTKTKTGGTPKKTPEPSRRHIVWGVADLRRGSRRGSRPADLPSRVWFASPRAMREWLRHSPDAKHYRVRLAKAVLIELHERVWPSASVQSGRTRFPGITADARRLGVNRATLFKMLAGYPGFAGLKSLRARYRALRKEVA